MFRNEYGGVWFFPKSGYCTNLNDSLGELFKSSDYPAWSTSGKSKRLAPNILGGW